MVMKSSENLYIQGKLKEKERERKRKKRREKMGEKKEGGKKGRQKEASPLQYKLNLSETRFSYDLKILFNSPLEITSILPTHFTLSHSLTTSGHQYL